MLRNLSVLFTWAVNQHHMAKNPCLGMTVEESTVKKSAVRILSIEEACRLLHLAATGFKVEAADERKRIYGGKNLVRCPSPSRRWTWCRSSSSVALGECVPRSPPA